MGDRKEEDWRKNGGQGCCTKNQCKCEKFTQRNMLWRKTMWDGPDDGPKCLNCGHSYYAHHGK